MQKKSEPTAANQTPTKYLLSFYNTRLGTILSNLSFVCLFLTLASLASFIVSFIVWIVGFFAIIFSIGTIFAIVPNYWDTMMKSAELMGKVGEVIFKLWPVVGGLGIAFSIISIVLLACDKNKKHTARITISSIVLLIIIALVIALAVR